VPTNVIESLKLLCKTYLEPLRNVFGPIIINSGWRTEDENLLAGGAYRSYHLTGKAADIRCESMDDAIRKAAYLLSREQQFIIKTNMIAELIVSWRPTRGTYWLHVAMKRDMHDDKHLVTFQKYG